MGEFDWKIFAEVLSGAGTFLVGLAAMLTLLFQYGYKRKAVELKESLKQIFLEYRQIMASAEGVALSDYPDNADQVVASIASRTKVKTEIIRNMLDELYREGRI